MPYRVLFCASEAFPLVKTGGLADVAGSLTPELQAHGHDVWLMIPAYRSVLAKIQSAESIATFKINEYQVRLLKTFLPSTQVMTILVDCPELYDRPGTPYHDEHGHDWHDNAQRFAVFSHAIVAVATDQLGLKWQADVLHANDWQTGLALALLDNITPRPALIFTIHNLAYQGVFDRKTFDQLHLPEAFWHYDALEYHGSFSFMKAGLVYADRINAVSPNYAREIQTPAFGHGLDGLLHYRRDKLCGILNGIDNKTWDPSNDHYIDQTYDISTLENKLINKVKLQMHFELPQDADVLVIGTVGRLVDQKGIDLVLTCIPHWINQPIQWIIVGTGDKRLEQAILQLAKKYPKKVGVHIGYDEGLAHRVEAGADVFLMPSRFEPCGLNQMYSQRYGTLPIVSPVGGLFDTVTNYSESATTQLHASGFVMHDTSTASLDSALRQVQHLFKQKLIWNQLQLNAMQKDFSWHNSALAYIELYTKALSHPDVSP